MHSLLDGRVSSLLPIDISLSAHRLDSSFHNAVHLDVYFLNSHYEQSFYNLSLLILFLQYVLTTCQNLSVFAVCFTMYPSFPVDLARS